jgi:hypothetical protein
MQVNSQPDQPSVWFPRWSTALQQLRLTPLRRQHYRLALIRYLQYCKQTHQQATVESTRAFMALRAPFMQWIQAKRLLGVSMLATWKEALNWSFKEARKQDDSGLAVGTDRRAVRNMKTNRRTEPVRPTNVMTDKMWQTT